MSWFGPGATSTVAEVARRLFFWRRLPLVFDMQGSLVGELEEHGYFRRAGWLRRSFMFLERLIDRFPDRIIGTPIAEQGFTGLAGGVAMEGTYRPVVELTQREREVAILTCRGMTSKEIGLELKLSYRTVEEYRAWVVSVLLRC